MRHMTPTTVIVIVDIRHAITTHVIVIVDIRHATSILVIVIIGQNLLENDMRHRHRVTNMGHTTLTPVIVIVDIRHRHPSSSSLGRFFKKTTTSPSSHNQHATYDTNNCHCYCRYTTCDTGT